MDWKLFPQTQVNVFNHQITRNIRVSRHHLLNNVEALLRRDKTDCKTKQLNGLIASTERTYQVTPKFRRRIEVKVKGNINMRGGDIANCRNSYENNDNRNSSRSEGNEMRIMFQNKTKHSHCEGSTTETYSKELLHNSKTLRPTKLSSKTSSDKERGSLTRKFSVEKECKGDELPGNGWWNEQRLSNFSYSENEEKEDIQKTEQNGNLDQDDTVNQFVLPLSTTRRIVQTLSSSSGEDLGETDSCSFEKGQIQTSCRSNFRERQCSAVGQSSEGKAFDIFRLTSVETCASKVTRNGEYCTPLLPRSDAETKANDFQFDDDLYLTSDQLFRYDTRTTSRLTCKTIKPRSSNFVVKCRLNDKINNFAKGQETQQVLPRMTKSKLNKIAPVGTADDTQRPQGEVNSPVKLRLKHRGEFLAQSRGAAEIIKGTDERMLPTTLQKSADASYSIMSPYMASVVWSVMADEESTITRPSTVMNAD